MKIEEIKKLSEKSKIKWSTHCLERMQERDITRADVKNCIENGEIIEDYPDDFPYPSCLVFGYNTNNNVIHVVVGSNGEFLYIITVYIPTTEVFENDLKTRKRKGC